MNPYYVALGDTICEFDVKEIIDSPDSMIGIRKVDDPRDFGVATIDENGFIEHFGRKASYPKK